MFLNYDLSLTLAMDIEDPTHTGGDGMMKPPVQYRDVSIREPTTHPIRGELDDNPPTNVIVHRGVCVCI